MSNSGNDGNNENLNKYGLENGDGFYSYDDMLAQAGILRDEFGRYYTVDAGGSESEPGLENMTGVESAIVMEGVPEVEPAPAMDSMSEAEVMPEVEPAPAMDSMPEAEVMPEVETTPLMDGMPEAETMPEVEMVPVMDTMPEAEVMPEVKPAPAMETIPEVKSTSVTDAISELENESALESVSVTETTPAIEPVPETDSIPEKAQMPEVSNDTVPEIENKSDEEGLGSMSPVVKTLLIGIIVVLLVLILGLLIVGAINHLKSYTPDLSKNNKSKTESLVSADGDSSSDASAEASANASWFSTATIYNPIMTDDTVSLKKANMKLFTNGDDNPWGKTTLTLEAQPGSLNTISSGEPTKTTQFTSSYLCLVDLDSDTIVAERNGTKVINPASMTKILTVLTARDYIDETKMDDTFTMTADLLQDVQSQGATCVGFLEGDKVTVRDLLYGTILCSGADAAVGLARYCCGSEDVFVEKMNENVEKLGLSETAHFTNVIGMYDEDLHCTARDMAVMLGVAVQDPLLRKVLSAHTYTTSTKYPDEGLPNGIEISNLFLRRIEDQPLNGTVVAAKTGFVNESGCCAASYYETKGGKKYVCVTGNSYSSWRTIYDHTAVYRSFTN